MPDLNPHLDSNQRVLEPAQAAPSPMLVLARSLTSHGPVLCISSFEEECSRAAAEIIDDLAQFSQSFNAEIAFMPTGPTSIELRVSGANSFSMMGVARVQMRSCHYERSFETSRATVLADSQEAAVRCLISAHAEFSYGMEAADDLSGLDDEHKAHAEFLAALPQIGQPGILLRDALLCEHAWNWPRTSTAMDLEALIGEAARDGLIPRSFANSKIVLGGGFPGEPTELWVWDVFQDQQSRHGSRGASILGALSFDKGGDYASWPLPALDQGIDVMWAALCGHISRAQASGWSTVPSYLVGEDATAASAAAVERLVLSELSAPSHEAAPRRRAAL